MAVLSIGGRRAIGKRALHGGLFGPVLRGLFLGHSRIESVVGASLRLRAAGVPTPEVIAAGWRPMAGPFCSLALLTEAIPGAASLHECLLDPATTPARRHTLLRAAGETVARMHAAGFLHADLNLANLVVESGAGGPRIHVVDLDGGRFVRGMTDRAALGNLRRLLRSWMKHVEARVRGGGRDLAAFLHGYTRDRAARRRLARALDRQRSRLWLRRIAWGLRG
jgi:tRNA A-37 threonylcarbamoyl transferase component Bud32